MVLLVLQGLWWPPSVCVVSLVSAFLLRLSVSFGYLSTLHYDWQVTYMTSRSDDILCMKILRSNF